MKAVDPLKLFGGGTTVIAPPPIAPPPVMPTPDDDAVRAAKRRSRMSQFARQGRESTVLAPDLSETLG